MKRFVMFMTALFTFLTLAYPAAFAGKYDLKSITPEVNRAHKGRQARYAQLQDMKRSGLVGENNKGSHGESEGRSGRGNDRGCREQGPSRHLPGACRSELARSIRDDGCSAGVRGSPARKGRSG